MFMIDYSKILHNLKAELGEREVKYGLLTKISAPFIPSFNNSFNETKNRVIFVGQETNGWHGDLYSAIKSDDSIASLIKKSQKSHDGLSMSNDVKSNFLKFMRKIREANDKQFVQWLNFYAFDFNKSSLHGLKNKDKELYEELVEFSLLLLSEQIKKLSPKVIFFAGQYHGNYPKLESMMNLGSAYSLHQNFSGLSLKVWNDETLIIRIPHPGSWCKKSRTLRFQSLEILKLFNQSRDIREFKHKIEIAQCNDISDQ